MCVIDKIFVIFFIRILCYIYYILSMCIRIMSLQLIDPTFFCRWDSTLLRINNKVFNLYNKLINCDLYNKLFNFDPHNKHKQFKSLYLVSILYHIIIFISNFDPCLCNNIYIYFFFLVFFDITKLHIGDYVNCCLSSKVIHMVEYCSWWSSK